MSYLGRLVGKPRRMLVLPLEHFNEGVFSFLGDAQEQLRGFACGQVRIAQRVVQLRLSKV